MKRLSMLFARRYLVSKKSHSVINIISRVSAFAVGVPVAAMVVLLSVFNGFEGLVKGMYNDFDPDIAIVAMEGKVFSADSIDRQALFGLEEVAAVSEMLEDNGLLEYRGRQYIGMIRGVDSLYGDIVPMDGMIVDGRFELKHGDFMQAIVGYGITRNIGIRTALADPIKVLVPRRGGFSTLLPLDSYRTGAVFPVGVFQLSEDTDGKYIIVPIEFTRELFDYPNGVTALMVKLKQGVDADKVRGKISGMLGDDYKVLTRYQQKASLYKIMSYEKWGIFLIILMVLIIASFSIVGSLAMLIIDKKDDRQILITMGGDTEFIRGIFIREGMLISTIGAIAGMILGLLVCWLQMEFGFVKIPAKTFLVDSYPVVVKAWDLVAVVTAFIAVNYIIIKFTVLKMIRRSDMRI